LSEAGDAHGEPRDRPPPGEAARDAPAPRSSDAHVVQLARTGDATCITILVRHLTRLPCRRPRDHHSGIERSPAAECLQPVPVPANFQTSPWKPFSPPRSGAILEV